MIILVANLGSTSFKYKLLDTDENRQLASGSVDRIGEETSQGRWEIGQQSGEFQQTIGDHGVAVDLCLKQLTDSQTGCLKATHEISAIGFKAVHGGKYSGTVLVDDAVLEEMERMNFVAPAHNPVYIAAMKQLEKIGTGIPLVASFETSFHQDAPEVNRSYAIPYDWTESIGIRRWGFHGASHRFIAQQAAMILPKSDLKVISCHLGGSSSVCGIGGGKSIGASMGMSPQSGLPQNNRVGDFDPFAIPVIMKQTGKSLQEVLDVLANQSGLLGISGSSGDLRDLRSLAESGNLRCQQALKFFVSEVRRYIGAYVMQLGPPDLIAFTGGIGQNDWQLRREICRDLQWLGVDLDTAKNELARNEMAIHQTGSPCQVWVLATNEEIVVANQVKDFLEGRECS